MRVPGSRARCATGPRLGTLAHRWGVTDRLVSQQSVGVSSIPGHSISNHRVGSAPFRPRGGISVRRAHPHRREFSSQSIPLLPWHHETGWYAARGSDGARALARTGGVRYLVSATDHSRYSRCPRGSRLSRVHSLMPGPACCSPSLGQPARGEAPRSPGNLGPTRSPAGQGPRRPARRSVSVRSWWLMPIWTLQTLPRVSSVLPPHPW